MNVNDCGNRCAGCQACGAACPKKAISFSSNAEGFLYPQVDQSNCVECGLCLKTCPLYDTHSLKIPEKAFAAVANDRKLRDISSSGGIFAVLAKQVLSEGGYVFGAAMHEDYLVRHICISDVSQLHRLQGSKYVQSDLSGVYEKLSDLLRSGKTVLFSGTPCQVAGVKQAAKQIPDNHLITVDLVCHGVPSPLFFQKHIAAAYGDVEDVRFRHRTRYELNCFAMGFTRNGEKYLVQPTDKDSYYACFFSYVSLRESCYTCPYAGPARAGDLTLGDLGTHALYEDILGNDRALSLVAVNTPRGEALLEACKESIASTAADYSAEARINKQLSAPVKRPASRDVFYRELFAKGYSEQVAGKYGKKMTMKEAVRYMIVSNVPQQTRKQIKKLLKKLRG